MWTAAAAETTSVHVRRSPFTGLTEPSNNYHANRNTQANTSTHKDTQTHLHRRKLEEEEEEEGAAELHPQSGFSLHISGVESVQSCGIHPPPALMLLLPSQT